MPLYFLLGLALALTCVHRPAAFKALVELFSETAGPRLERGRRVWRNGVGGDRLRGTGGGVSSCAFEGGRHRREYPSAHWGTFDTQTFSSESTGTLGRGVLEAGAWCFYRRFHLIDGLVTSLRVGAGGVVQARWVEFVGACEEPVHGAYVFGGDGFVCGGSLDVAR